MIVTRTCPGCRKRALVPVEGGLGKMGRCPACGWTGAMRLEDEDKGTPWQGLRLGNQEEDEG